MRTSSLLATAVAVTLAAAPTAAQQVPAEGASSPRDVTALLPEETVLAIDGADLAAFATGARDVYKSVSRRMPRPYRGLALLLDPFLRSSVGIGLGDLADGEIEGEWALGVVAVDNGPVPVFVARSTNGKIEKPYLGGKSALTAQVEDGVLVVAASERHCARYHAWRRDQQPTLAAKDDYLRGRVVRPGRDAARVYIDIARIRGDRGEPMLDPAGMLLVGPIVAALGDATRFDGVVRFDAGGATVRGKLDGGVLGGARPERHLLAHPAKAYRLPPAPNGTIATLCLDRSLAGFWGNLDALLGEGEVVEAQSFLSIADQLVAGSFVDDLVPSLGDPITLFAVDVVDEDAPAPTIELPAFVFVAEKRAERATKMLSRLLSTIVSIQKVEAKQNGELPFDLRRTKTEHGEVMSVANPSEWRGPGAPPTAAGLSPTLAFGGEHVVFSSTRAGAEAMLAALRAGGTGEDARGDVVRVSPPLVAEYVRKNLASLVINNVLEKGKTRKKAQLEHEFFAALLDRFSHADLAWQPADAGTSVTLTLEVQDD